MSFALADADFLFADMPEAVEPERGSFAWMQHEIKRLRDLNARHGAMLTQAQVAVALGVSRARVGKLVASGRLPTEEVADCRYVPADSLVELMKEEPSKYCAISKIRLALAGFNRD
jgi:hypothetical protein